MNACHLFSAAVAAALLFPLHASGQENALEDAPFEPSASVVEGTKAALSDSSIEVVALTIRALGDWREDTAAADVAKLLKPDVSPSIRIEAMRYFARLGERARPFIGDVLEQAGDPDPNIRAAVATVVLEAQACAEHRDTIGDMLDDVRSDVRIAAAQCLGQAGPTAASQRDALLEALRNSGTDELRAAALDALGHIGGMSVANIEAIKPYLRSRDAEVRVAAWVTFMKAMAAVKNAGTISAEEFAAARTEYLPLYEAEPPEVKAAINEALRGDTTTLQTYLQGRVEDILSGTPEMKSAALRALGEAGEAALDQLPLILEEAKNPNAVVRAGAIAAIGSLGPAAVKPNIAIVANALLDESVLVRDEALRALSVGGDALADFPYRIAEVYPTASPGVRETLIRAVPIRARIVGMDEDDLARARSALTDEDPDLRIGMAYVMGQLGPELGGPLLPQLLPLVNDPEPAVRGAAIISLRAFATDAGAKQKLREVLRPLLGDQDAEVRWAVLDTLHEVDPGQEPDLVDAIAALVRDEDQSVRSAAVRALGAAGPTAAKHLPAVVEFFLDDPAIPPFGAAETVLRISPLTPVQLTSVLYPLYVYPELTPLTRATAYAASGGDKDGLLIVRLLGRARVPAKDIVRPSDAEHAATVLRDALGATLLHQDLEAEIGTRIGEIEALR